MALGDLLKKLYKKKDELNERELDKDVYDASGVEQAEDGFSNIEGEILKTQGNRDITEEQEVAQKSKLFVFGGIVLIVLLLILGVVFVYFKIVGSAFLEEKVEISISGSSEVRSAENTAYTIRVENFNRVALQNVKISLNYSETMVIQDKPYIQKEGFKSSKIVVGSIKAKEKKEYEVIFKPFGPRDRQVFLNAAVQYQPSNFNSEFEKLAQKSIVIKSSPITITLIPVKKAASGEKVHLDAIVKNNSNLEFEDLELKLDYPEGFSFEVSNPAPSRDKNIWRFEKLGSKAQIKVGIDGIIEGVPDSLKNFKAELGERRTDNEMLVFTENEAVMKMISSRVEIRQEVISDSIYAGESTTYNIKFKNTSDVPLRDLILIQYIDSEVIKKEKVRVPLGHYDSKNNTVIWKASQVPALKLLMPGEEGLAITNLPTINEVPMNNENDKNFTINSYVELESLDIDSPLWQNKRIRSSQKQVSINSKMIVEVEGLFHSEELPNTGPIPTVINEETTFTIYMRIKNTSNDLKNVILTTKFPSGIVWKNNYFPRDAGMDFNERTNELKLIIGSVEAGAGFISPEKKYAFQVGVIPSENQLGERAYILNDLTSTAIDTFTGNEVSYEFSVLDVSQIKDVEAKLIDTRQ